jgi:hypothetical protein
VTDDGAYIGDDWIPYGGKVLVRVYCGKASRSPPIAEIRTDPDAGPLLWYRVNVLHAGLMAQDQGPASTREGNVIAKNVSLVIDRIELIGGNRIEIPVPTAWGSKAQRGGRIPALNEYRSVLRMRDRDRVIDMKLGCPTCGEHEPDLGQLQAKTDKALGSPKSLKVVV